MLRIAVLFQRQSPQPGWVAIAMMGERACAAYVADDTDGRPCVHWIEHLPWSDSAASLRHLRQARGLARHATTGVLARHQYQLMATDAPDVPREEWRSALRWKLQEQVDFPVETASIDLLEVPAHTNQRGRPAVIALAASRAALTPLTLAAHQAGVRWRAFDVVECALRNLSALMPPPIDSQRGQALLHVGNDYTTLVITAGGELLQSRTIDVSVAQLLSANDNTLASGDANAAADATAAADAAANRPADASDSQVARADVFLAAADRIGLEVQRTLDNFERQFTEVAMARLLVAPGSLRHFIGHVRDLVYTPVEAYDPTPAFDIDSRATRGQFTTAAQQADALIALGAALRAL